MAVHGVAMHAAGPGRGRWRPVYDRAVPGASPTSPRVRLVVLYGGRSAEHDVSCVSGAHIAAAADPARYDVVPIGVSRGGAWTLDAGALPAVAAGARALPDPDAGTGNVVGRLPGVLSPVENVPTVVFPIIHGTHGEDGTLQGLLEQARVPYVGTGVLGSALCMDKAMARMVMAAHGIPHAKGFDVTSGDDPVTLTSVVLGRMRESAIAFPVFVKPANMGSSLGITKAHDAEELLEALTIAVGYDERVVVEETVVGREIEVAVLGNSIGALPLRASVPGEIVAGAEFYDYADKYTADAAELLIPAPLDATVAGTVRALALDAYRALRCDGMARVDFFYEADGRGFLLNEINTLPGFTPLSMYPKLWAASGLTTGDLIDELVRLAIERNERRATFRTDA